MADCDPTHPFWLIIASVERPNRPGFMHLVRGAFTRKPEERPNRIRFASMLLAYVKMPEADGGAGIFTKDSSEWSDLSIDHIQITYFHAVTAPEQDYFFADLRTPEAKAVAKPRDRASVFCWRVAGHVLYLAEDDTDAKGRRLGIRKFEFYLPQHHHPNYGQTLINVADYMQTKKKLPRPEIEKICITQIQPMSKEDYVSWTSD
jgi:hypothetical protein